MKRTILAALAATLLAGAASGADLQTKAPYIAAHVPPPADWTGFYVGVEGGYGWGNDGFGFGGVTGTQDDTDVNKFTVNPASNPTTSIVARAINLPFVVPGLDSIKTKGFLAGGFFGAQKQMGSWVVGLEGDIDAASISGSGSNEVITTATTPDQLRAVISFKGPPVVNVSLCCATLPTGVVSTTDSMITVDRKIDALGSVRGKIGFTPAQNFMLYGTGGPAWAHQTTDVTFQQTTTGTVLNFGRNANNQIVFGPHPFTTAATGTASNGAVLFGWAAGVGGDLKVTENIIAGAEYLHYDFGKVGFALTNAGGVSLAGNGKTTVDAVKARLSWLIH